MNKQKKISLNLTFDGLDLIIIILILAPSCFLFSYLGFSSTILISFGAALMGPVIFLALSYREKKLPKKATLAPIKKSPLGMLGLLFSFVGIIALIIGVLQLAQSLNLKYEPIAESEIELEVNKRMENEEHYGKIQMLESAKKIQLNNTTLKSTKIKSIEDINNEIRKNTIARYTEIKEQVFAELNVKKYQNIQDQKNHLKNGALKAIILGFVLLMVGDLLNRIRLLLIKKN